MGHVLVRQDVGCGSGIMVLADEDSEETFLDEMAGDPRTRETASRIVRAAHRISESGIAWAIDSQTLKRLKGTKGLALFELRAKGTVHRVMTYVHAGSTPVLLFHFEGHVRRAGGRDTIRGS